MLISYNIQSKYMYDKYLTIHINNIYQSMIVDGYHNDKHATTFAIFMYNIIHWFRNN